MSYRKIVVIAMVVATFLASGCQSTPKPTLLPARVGASVAEARHNDEGIHAYKHGQWDSAKQHFEAAIAASPELAGAHYNLGKTTAVQNNLP